jgi:hypothetical protein
MYTVGARTSQVDAFTPPTAVQAEDGAQLASNQMTLRPVETATVQRVATTSRPARRASRPAAVQERTVRESPDERSWGKTAMIIGGSAASGAAVGGIVDGKKGALIGAAIGGGAASIYEATRRR